MLSLSSHNFINTVSFRLSVLLIPSVNLFIFPTIAIFSSTAASPATLANPYGTAASPATLAIPSGTAASPTASRATCCATWRANCFSASFLAFLVVVGADLTFVTPPADVYFSGVLNYYIHLRILMTNYLQANCLPITRARTEVYNHVHYFIKRIRQHAVPQPQAAQHRSAGAS